MGRGAKTQSAISRPVPLPLRVKAGNPFASAAIPGVAVPAFRLDFGDILRDAPAIDTRIPVIGLVCVVTPGRRGERHCQARDGENLKREETNATRSDLVERISSSDEV